MAKVFEQFHFSLIEREQIDMFDPQMPREDWLRNKFSHRFEFRHMGKDFFWVPQNWSTEFMAGVIERKRAKTQHRAPDEGGDEYLGEEWQGSIVIIDPIHRPDGQKVAFEYDATVGQPSAILDSLVAHLNGNSAHQYALHYKPLFKQGTFWKFAEKHGGVLQYVAFKFTVPNMIFGTTTKTTDGLKRIGADTGAQEVEVRLESDDGVKASSETVAEAVDYAEDGNARVTAKAQNGEYWSSTKQKVTVKMQSILNFANEKKETVEEWLRQALNRDQETAEIDPDSAVVGNDRGSDRDKSEPT